MSSTSPHPTEGQLQDFLDGRLPVDEHTSIEHHVSTCDFCTSKMSETRIRSESRAEAVSDSLGFSVDPPDSNSTQAWADAVSTEPDTPVPHGLAHHPRYKLLRQIGAGGMGTVWLAEHSVLGRNVALKVIRSEYLAKPGAVERFRRESRAVAKLQHANIVTAYDAEEAEGTHFLVMEYVEGVNLGDLVKGRGPMPIQEAVKAGMETALGLAAAHAAGMIHRDIKPHNLIRTIHGRTKILDFGLATAEAGSGELTGENVVMGTPDYIAPEQALDAHTADARSDIYSLGCSMYIMLTGKVPYPVAGTLKKIDAHRAGRHVPIRVLRPEVPEALAAAVAKMMAKRPEDRYRTALEAAEALTEWKSERRPPRRWNRKAVAAAVLLAACIAAVAIVYGSKNNGVVAVVPGEPTAAPAPATKPEGKPAELLSKLILAEARAFNHTGNVTELRFTADGSGVVVNGTTAAILDTAKATLVKAFLPGKGRHIALSPDGKLVAAWVEEGEEDFVQTWDMESGTPQRKYGPYGLLRAERSWLLRFAPDGKHLLIGQADALDRANLEDNAFERLIVAPQNTEMRFAAFSPDGTKLAIPDTDTIRVMSYPKIKEFGRAVLTSVPQNGVRSVAWIHGGAGLAAMLNTGEIRGFASPGGNEIFRIQAHEAEGNLTAFPDGRRFVSVSADGWLRVWDAETGRKLGEVKDSTMLGVAVAPDGRTIATGSTSGKVTFWTFQDYLPTGRIEETAALRPHANGRVNDIAFTPDGRSAVSVDGNGTVFLRQHPSGNVIHEYRAKTHPDTLLAVSRDAAALAVGALNGANVYDLKSGTQSGIVTSKGIKLESVMGQATATFPEPYGRVRAARFRPDGKRLAVVGLIGIRCWNLESAKEQWRLAIPGEWQHDAVFSADGATFFAGGGESDKGRWGRVRELDSSDGKTIRTFDFPSTVGRLALSPDGRRLAVLHGKTASVLELESGKEVWKFHHPGGTGSGLAFLPDGKELAVLGQIDPDDAKMGIVVWNTETGKFTARITPKNSFGSLAIAPDGTIATGGQSDGAVRYWKLATR